MALEKLLRMTQPQLKKALRRELAALGYRPMSRKGFLYAEGDVPVLLVAHMDTVHDGPVKTLCRSECGDILMSPEGVGGDDRAGCHMVLEIARRHRCHVLFCEDEEKGGVGAHLFAESGVVPEVNYIVGLDRRGSDDAVFYDCDNPDFAEFVEGFGFRKAMGSFSDISVVAPELGIAAVNLSCGFYDEHTLHERVDMAVVRRNVERVCEMVCTETGVFEYMDAEPWFYDDYGCMAKDTALLDFRRYLRLSDGSLEEYEDEDEYFMDAAIGLDKFCDWWEDGCWPNKNILEEETE